MKVHQPKPRYLDLSKAKQHLKASTALLPTGGVVRTARQLEQLSITPPNIVRTAPAKKRPHTAGKPRMTEEQRAAVYRRGAYRQMARQGQIVQTVQNHSEQKPKEQHLECDDRKEASGGECAGVLPRTGAVKRERTSAVRKSNAEKQVQARGTAAGTRKKRSVAAKLGRLLAGLLCAVLFTVGGLYIYAAFMLNAGNSPVTNDLKVETPPELSRDHMNILVLGLDYTQSDADVVQRSKDDPQADMIMYVQYDKKAKTIKMLQVPRDLYMGDFFATGGTGKINAVYKFGEHKDNRVQNLVEVFNKVFHLSIDHWITIDMESLRQMVEVFGGGAGIPVNIPFDLVEYDEKGNVKYQLPAGEHNLKGYDLEFFLRARKAEGMHRGDVDRLDNQKIFYSALFRYMRTMSWQEMVKLMPFFLKYIKTDINPLECAALGVSVMGVPNENILIGTLPCILNQGAYYGSNQVVPIAPLQAAEFLNLYFRPPQAPIGLENLMIPTISGITEPVVPGVMKSVLGDGTVAEQLPADSQTVNQPPAAA